MFRRLATASVLWLALTAPVAGSAQAAPEHALPNRAADAAYVMGYFEESLSGAGNVNAVHLAVSQDALEWTPLNDGNPVLTPTQGTRGIRDPFVFRRQDGSWVLVATDIPVGGDFARPNPNIHVWTSPDLVSWSADRLLTVNRPNPNSFSWAPAVHWDPNRQQYGITFSGVPSGGSRAVILVVYTTDFVSVTSPVVFHDPGASDWIIDSHVVTDGGVGYLYYKDFATGRLVGARSTTLAPRSFTRYTDVAVTNACTEAPTLVRSLTSNTWWLWGDTYCPNARFDVWSGNLAAGSWSQLGRQSYTAPLNGKHNTIHPITAADRDRLLQRYGGTSWTRLKSWNFPGHYVRHAGNVGRVDELPFDPYQDAQWRLVPGLADGQGVSFESVNFPGRYLRHVGFEVRLAQNDGTAGFRADATFYRVAGLAQSSWSSFRSYNYPTRHLRHSGFVLRVDEVTDQNGRADATFHIGH